jgi:predicted ester cyclase
MVPANEAVVREHFARYDDNDPQGSAAVFAENVMNHGRPVTRAQVELVLQSLRQAAPDATTEVRELVSDGEVVVCRVTGAGTHLGTPDLAFVDGGVFTVGRQAAGASSRPPCIGSASETTRSSSIGRTATT